MSLDSVNFQTMAQLEAALPHILDAPKDGGRLDLIVSRPSHGARDCPERTDVSAEMGVAGDHWARGCWKTLADGRPDPDVQICMMMSRVIGAIAGSPENWASAGDNLFIDMDLTPANTPPGTRFALGSAEFVVSEEPHNGCQSFIDRYGRDACLFVNTGTGKEHRFRGIYARVAKDGEIALGDRFRKL